MSIPYSLIYLKCFIFLPLQNQDTWSCLSNQERHVAYKCVFHRNSQVTILTLRILLCNYWANFYQIYVLYVFHIHNLMHNIWRESAQQFARYVFLNFAWCSCLVLRTVLKTFEPTEDHLLVNWLFKFGTPIRRIVAYLIVKFGDVLVESKELWTIILLKKLHCLVIPTGQTTDHNYDLEIFSRDYTFIISGPFWRIFKSE